MKTFKMMGRRWRLLFVSRLGEGGISADGNCDHPETKNKAVRIRQDLREKDLMETLLHEGLHAADWSKDEQHVHDMAIGLSDLLWGLGYRRAGE